MTGYNQVQMPWLFDEKNIPVGVKMPNGIEVYIPTISADGVNLRAPDGSIFAPWGSGNGATTFAALTNTPSTLAGYGITDAVTQSTLSGYATTAQVSQAVAGKFNAPIGNTSQYVRGDGSLATLDAYPASSNPSGFLTGITAAQITGALGMTPVSLAGARAGLTLTTTGAGVSTYNATTGVLNIPAPVAMEARAFSSPARALNTPFQVSTTRDAMTSYSVDIAATAAVLAGANGRVFLEYADDSAFKNNVVQVSSSAAGVSGVLNAATVGSGAVTGIIPAGKYVRLRTNTVTGSPTFTLQGAQEVLL